MGDRVTEDAGHTLATADRPSFHALPAAATLAHWQVSREAGLSAAEAAGRLARYGPNRLEEVQRVSLWTLLIRQLASPVVALLGAAMALSIVMGNWVEAAAIAIVIVINTVIGFVAEERAVRSMEALRKLDVETTRVRRDGVVRDLPAEDLVPGDIVVLEAGDRVPADLRIVTASNLMADESALTGESVPVGKAPDPVPEAAKIHDRRSLLFKGTGLTNGAAEAVVFATATATELGKIADLVEHAASGRSPLEDRLEALAQQLVWLTIVIALALAALGIWTGQPVLQMAQAAIALAVAAIPEGLPIVATLALALGMLRMAERNALVKSLGAVETLGATTVILTDKTGTLTENKMRAVQVLTADGVVTMDRVEQDAGAAGTQPVLGRLLETAALCVNATYDGKTGMGSGDPMEVALLEAADRAGIDRAANAATHPRLIEHAFDPSLRMMATIHRGAADGNAEDDILAAVKGAPEAVLAHVSRIATPHGAEAFDAARREALERSVAALAADGYRLIAVANGTGVAREVTPYDDLTLLGVIALQDPPRSDIPAAVDACHAAGVHVVMVTGDHPATARAIAASVGFDPDRHGDAVHARVTPSEKLDLVSGFQDSGEIVAMTGDGVNDAPALKKADIGIAMGQRGTDIAREAADIVLRDDAFSTIVYAIREGRIIFENIRRFCVFLLSCNLGEVLLIAIALLLGWPLPLLPLQILFLNLVTDVFPAFALATSKGNPDIANHPPRPVDEPILASRHWQRVALFGIFISLSSLAAFAVALFGYGMTDVEAATVAFLTIALAQLWHVFSMRNPQEGMFVNEITRNKWVWGALVLCVALLVVAVYVPVVQIPLAIVPPTLELWGVILGFSLIPLVLGQIYVQLRR